MMFSIIIPCLNEEDYILALLKSLESQRFPTDNFEVIVVDNGSSDSTTHKVKMFQQDSPINLRIEHCQKRGVSRAKNLGAKMALTNYLIFIDADNTVKPDFLSSIDQKCSSGELAGTIRLLANNKLSFGYFVFIFLEIIKRVFKRPFGKSFVCKKVFFLAGGFNEDIQLGENVDFLLRVKKVLQVKFKKNLAHIKSPLYCSLRRFREDGYSKVLMQWFAGYIGLWGLKYKPLNASQHKNSSNDLK